jgi:hypothetical protein
MTVGDWHYHNDFIISGVRFDSSFDHSRINAAFWMPEPGQSSRRILTLGWGAYWVEVRAAGAIEWYLTSSNETLRSAEDLEKFGIVRDAQIAALELSGELYRDHSPYFTVNVEGVMGEDTPRLFGHDRLSDAFDEAHEILTNWVTRSEEPPSF